MSRPRQFDDRVSCGLRLDADLHARLTAAANERDVPLNWLICKLLAEGVERLIPADELTLVRRPDA